MKPAHSVAPVSLLAGVVMYFTGLTASAQNYCVLHHFAGGAGDGAKPYGALVQSGMMLYGMTAYGGSNNVGTIFRISAGDGGFQLLHTFRSSGATGQIPGGALLLSGSTWFGVTFGGGTGGNGVLFRMNDDGTGFQVLRQFSGSDGIWPFDSLIRSGPTLYGMCSAGAAGNAGTIFQIDTNGTGFQVLHTFAGGAADGSGPHGSLLSSASTFYGMTPAGGSSDGGTLFRMNTNGTGFQLAHTFAGGAGDGKAPSMGTPVQAGPILYGMTQFGGSGDGGTIFQINTNGSGFQLLHTFAGGTNDGQHPFGSLLLSGSMLYGMTRDGGIRGTNGTVFQINTNGTGFQLLHRFDGGDGSRPYGSLLLSGSTLYGMTFAGGSQGKGVIFALDLPRPTLAILLNDTNVALSWSTNFPDFSLESTGQLADSWTPVPGVTGYSATLSVNPETNRFFRLRK
jgi:uncharacterized repeat protein (TIGR03803 family)